jgi:hypothetical protein
MMGRPKAGRDKIISYDILKRLLEEPKETEAYKLGLVDENGELLREPETDEEKEAFTTLDMLLMKIKELIGAKMVNLRQYMYVNNYDNTIIEDIVLRNESKADRAYLDRIEKDIRKSLE